MPVTRIAPCFSLSRGRTGASAPGQEHKDSKVKASRYGNVAGLQLQADTLIIEEQLLFQLPIRGLNNLVSTLSSC